MTMDFTAIDAVDFSQLKEGRHVRVKINQKFAGGYQVIDIEVLDEQMSDDPTSNDLIPNGKSVIDHSNH